MNLRSRRHKLSVCVFRIFQFAPHAKPWHGRHGRVVLLLALLGFMPHPAVAEPSESIETTSEQVETLTPRQQADLIIKGLGEASDEELVAIEDELAKIGRVSMVPLKLAELTGDLVVRERAARLANRLRWRLVTTQPMLKVYPNLIDVMASDDRQARNSLVDEIVKNQRLQPRTDFFTECLADPEPYVRQRAVEGLASVIQLSQKDRQQALNQLNNLLSESNDEQLHLACLAVLQDLKRITPQAVKPLLDSTSIEVRSSALLSLGMSRNPQAIDLVASQLEHPNWQIRAAALDALEDLENNNTREEIAKRVAPLLDDPDEFVQARVLGLLVELRYPKAGDLILAKIEDGSLDQTVGLRMLAMFGHPKALEMILEQYEQSETAQQKIALLEMLEPLMEHPNAQAIVLDILADEEQRDLWPIAIQLAANLNYNTNLIPLVGDKLLDEDDNNIARNAWEVMYWRWSRQPVPETLITKLRTHSDANKRKWALQILMLSTSTELISEAINTLDDPSDEVVDLSLGVLALAKGMPAFEIQEVTRPIRYVREGLHASLFTEQEQLVIEKLQKRLPDFETAATQIRAAALLRKLIGPTPEVEKYITQGLASDQQEVLIAALIGIMESPGDYLDGLDIDALLQSSATRVYVAAALATRGEPEDIKRVTTALGLIDDSSTAGPLLLALVRAGGPASDSAFGYFRDLDDWQAVRTLEQFNHASGPEVPRFVHRLLQRNVIETHYVDDVSEIAITFQDPAAADLLEAILTLPEDSYWFDRGPISQRLIELDPSRASDILILQLRNDGHSAYQFAAEQLPKIEPTDDLIKSFLKAATTNPKLTGNTSELIANWLPAEAVIDQFLPHLEQMDISFAIHILERVSTNVDQAAVEALLTVNLDELSIRGRVTEMLGRLLFDQPLNLEQYSPDQLSSALLAAGHHDEGRSKLQSYLEHEDDTVSQSALQGLSIWLASRHQDGIEPLSENEHNALAAALSSTDTGVSYLAAEALYQMAPKALAETPLSSITALDGKLRAIAAMDAWPSSAGPHISLALSEQARSTSKRLALTAALKHKQWRVFTQASRGQAIHWAREIAMDAALESGNTNLAFWVISNSRIPFRDDPDRNEQLLLNLQQNHRELARSTRLAVMLRQLPTDLDLDDLEQLLIDIDRTSSDRGYQPWQLFALSAMVADQVAPDGLPEDWLTKPGVQGTIAAALAQDHPEAEARLQKSIAIAIQNNAGYYDMPLESMIAIEALAMRNSAEIAPWLLEQAKTLSPDEWEDQWLYINLKQLLSVIEPELASQLPDLEYHYFNHFFQGETEFIPEIMAEGWEMPILSIERNSAIMHELKLATSGERANLLPLMDIVPSQFNNTALEFWESSVTQDDTQDASALDVLEQWASAVAHQEDDSEYSNKPWIHNAEYWNITQTLHELLKDQQHDQLAELVRQSLQSEEPLHIDSGLRVLEIVHLDGFQEALQATITNQIEFRLRAADLYVKMHPDESVQWFAEQYEQAQAFEDRAFFANWLWVMGQKRHPEIDREIQLYHASQLAMRMPTITPRPKPQGGGLFGALFGNSNNQSQPRNDSPDQWRADGIITASPSWLHVLLRYNRIPDHQTLGFPEKSPFLRLWAYQQQNILTRPSLDTLMLTSKGLIIRDMSHVDAQTQLHHLNRLQRNQPLHSRLQSMERWLEPYFSVQFASKSNSPQDLLDHWQQWWEVSRDLTSEQWWHQALEQAVSELEDDRWWIRTQALGRLERLTGIQSPTASPWNQQDWNEQVVLHWQSWLDDHRQATRLEVLKSSIAQTDRLEQDNGFALKDIEIASLGDMDELPLLITMAGWGDPVQQQAALSMLIDWPNQQAFMQEALRWQHSSYAQLRDWIQGQVIPLADELKPSYQSSDLVFSP